MQGHRKWIDHSRKFWQNVVHWRKEWQPTPIFLLREPHEQYEKAKRYGTRRWPSRMVGRCPNMLPGKSRRQLLIALERMKQLGQSKVTLRNECVPVAKIVKNLPARWETWVQSLSLEDSLEKGMQTIPVFLPGEFHGQRSLAVYSPQGCKESDTTEWLRLPLFALVVKINSDVTKNTIV